MSKTDEHRIRVLLIDDDPDDYALTRDLLRELPGVHYHLDWASTYEAGLDAVCTEQHDVYLVDYRLGAESGLDFLAEVRGRGNHTPMILLTGQSMWELDLAAMQSGAADFLEKGRLDAVILERAIRYALQQARQEAELEKKVRERTAELAKANESLRKADRAKDEFLATLAHELRNPLAPIRNALEIMRLVGSDPAGVEKSRQMIDRQVRQLVRLIDDLLDVSRITRGKLALKYETLDLRDVVTAAAEQSQPLLDKAGVQLKLQLSAAVVSCVGDRVRLAQVVANLLNNAAKYTEPGGTATVTLEATPGAATIRVADTGVGLPAEVVPRVFDLFTQVDRTLNRSQGGLGIGLALVKKFVEMHGGTVCAASAGVGQGATFTVTLPTGE